MNLIIIELKDVEKWILHAIVLMFKILHYSCILMYLLCYSLQPPNACGSFDSTPGAAHCWFTYVTTIWMSISTLPRHQQPPSLASIRQVLQLWKIHIQIMLTCPPNRWLPRGFARAPAISFAFDPKDVVDFIVCAPGRCPYICSFSCFWISCNSDLNLHFW